MPFRLDDSLRRRRWRFEVPCPEHGKSAVKYLDVADRGANQRTAHDDSDFTDDGYGASPRREPDVRNGRPEPVERAKRALHVGHDLCAGHI